MKNLFTLFASLVTLACFGQLDFTPKNFVQCKVVPNSSRPSRVHQHSSVSRSTGPCDTSDVIDYNTYNEVVADNQALTFHGSWNATQPMPYAQEITSFVTVKSSQNQEYSYAMQAWDSLVFTNFNALSSYYFPQASSSVSLDSMGMFIGIAGDTVEADGKMAHDSLVFSFYSVIAGIVSASPALVVIDTGYAELTPFFVGLSSDVGFLRYASIVVGHQFSAGQGFAVKMQYLNKDTSSHLLLSFTYADSCGTITFQGQTFSSPAYPSPMVGTADYATNVGSSFWGEIDSTAPTTATVRNISNAFAYQITGIAANCSYVYNQNWEFLAYVTVTNTMDLTLPATFALTCGDTSPVALRPTLSGDYAQPSFMWTGGVHGSNSTSNTTINSPGTYTLSAINNVGCTATATTVASYPNVSNNVSFTVPSKLCENESETFTNTSSSTVNWNASWNMGDGSAAITTNNATYTYTSPNHLTVTLTMDSNGCSFSSSQNIYVGNCTGIENVNFENNISLLPNPSTGNVNVTINGVMKNVTVLVYNVIGTQVKSYLFNDVASSFNKSFDFSDLASGTYLIKFESGDQVAVKKLVIGK